MKKTILILTLLFLNACTTPPTAAPATEESLPSPTAVATVIKTTPTPEAIPTATFPAQPVPPTPVTYATRISPADDMPQVFVPAGKFQMGGFDIHAENDEIPTHEVTLKEFWIDQYEVTNGMYGLCVQAGVCQPPQKPYSSHRAEYFGNPEFQDYPVITVTWTDAQTYCTWAERRLPTEAEWERAARGDDMRSFPWGENPPSELLTNFNNLIRDTSRVGSYPLGVSPFGAYDMAGNVAEWVQDFYKEDYYKKSPGINPTGPAQAPRLIQRVIRGGSYQDVWVNIRVANRGYEMGPNPDAPFNSPDLFGRSSSKIGFRCASDH
jgi:formylglycine-generating enzyme required for sulfatase activity